MYETTDHRQVPDFFPHHGILGVQGAGSLISAAVKRLAVTPFLRSSQPQKTVTQTAASITIAIC
jgi:hypothetical protein